MVGMEQAGGVPDPIERIFEYDDYRVFLSDLFAHLKKSRRAFSYRWIARKAGFASHSFLEAVHKGRKHLTLESARALGEALDLKGIQQEYFEALVLRTTQTPASRRERNHRTLERIQRATSLARPDPSAWDYFRDWKLSVLRELATHAPWNDDHALLGSWMNPPMAPEECIQAMAFLVDHGFLRRENGLWCQTNPGLTAESVPERVFRNAKSGFIQAASRALDEQPRAQRHISSSTLSMGHATFLKASRMLAETRRRILALALEDDSVERAYVLNLQLFAQTARFRPGPDPRRT